jgi:hypothetical protein
MKNKYSLLSLVRENKLILYVFCMDYYSGQWSRGYRILSRLNKYVKRGLTVGECEVIRTNALYKYLESKYGNKI